MGMFRNRKRREKAESASIKYIADQFSVTMKELAEKIFSFAVTDGQELPGRCTRETAVKKMVQELLAPAVSDYIASGKSQSEAETYVELIEANAYLAFEKKWTELEHRLAAPQEIARVQ